MKYAIVNNLKKFKQKNKNSSNKQAIKKDDMSTYKRLPN